MAAAGVTVGVIAQGLFIKGDLHGEDDLIIEGRVEGTITLKKHLVVESTGIVVADVRTENITVKGEINGNMIATDKITIHAGACVLGDITARRVEVADNAVFNGRIQMATGSSVGAADDELVSEAPRLRLAGATERSRAS